MKKFVIFFSVLSIFLSSNAVISLAYDATGIWNYSEHDLWTNCGSTDVPESGQVGILQNGSKFLVYADDFSTYGTVSGNTYTYSDAFCEDGGVVSGSGSITLTSETSAHGTVNWTWSGGGQSCSGGHQLTLTKQAQAAPVYDATGRWNFNLSNISYNCGDGPDQTSGYFDVVQTGNKITAVDNLGREYNGFVNGTKYAVLRSYLQNGGRNTDWALVNLSSATQGTGEAGFVWDNDCDDCWGNWNISMTKEIPDHTITASAGIGGSISPAGAVSVEHGATQYFWFTPDKGYMVVSILYDGVLYDAKNWPGCYIENVDADHTLKVIFERIRVMSWLPLLLDDAPSTP